MKRLKGDRLSLLARLVREVSCRRLVDIGSDHATIPIRLLKQGDCQAVLVTDLRPGPLAVAVERASREGLTKGFQAIQTDGLEGIDLDAEDVLLISGLGGDTIAGILDRHAHQVRKPKRIIVQPQTRDELVRASLAGAGLAITDEICVEERGHIYLVLVSDGGHPPPSGMNDLEMYFGPVILSRLADRRGETPCRGYLTKKIRRLKKQSPYDSAAAERLRAFEQSFPITYNELDQC